MPTASNADTENRIGQKWRDQWPDLRGRHIRQHVHGSDPDHWIGIGEAAAGQIRIRGRNLRCELDKRVCPRDIGSVGIAGDSREELRGIGTIG